jgi:transcription elongation factor Elf1
MPTKTITPLFETIGKRRKLIGFRATYGAVEVGTFDTHHEAEVTLDELVFELLSSGATATATQLDGGSDADECAAEVVGMLVEVAQTETAHTNAPDCCCDACMRASYAYLNTLPSLPVDVAALVIRGDEPVQHSACVAEPIGQCYVCDAAAWQSDAYGPVCPSHSAVLDEWKEQQAIEARQRCLLCGGDHSAENCPRIHPIDVTPLLLEVDALLDQVAQHPGPNCYCPDCTRAAERLIIDAFMTRLRFDAGVLCSFCGDEHADSACPQKRPLLAPRVCGNCGGQHSIQQCSDIRRLLFAA